MKTSTHKQDFFKWADFGNDIHIGEKITTEKVSKKFENKAEYYRDYYKKNKHRYKGMEKHKNEKSQ